MSEQSLTATDNRTGKSYTLPIENGTVRAMDLRKIKTDEHDFGVMSYDPAFLNTASCQSAITFIDGDKGILRYRGYPIEQLAEKCTFLEVAYLILHGELPTEAQLKNFVADITHHTMLHETTKRFLERVSSTMRIPWACLSAPWRLFPRFIQTPETCMTRKCAHSKSIV
ncbi:MAG TPA: citrate/2-methylcitrate synthase [Terriglobales bacterium]|nr:citrate/2-methylcitrate synthase [Terriglobales bacterium]